MLGISPAELQMSLRNGIGVQAKLRSPAYESFNGAEQRQSLILTGTQFVEPFAYNSAYDVAKRQ